MFNKESKMTNLYIVAGKGCFNQIPSSHKILQYFQDFTNNWTNPKSLLDMNASLNDFACVYPVFGVTNFNIIIKFVINLCFILE